MGGALAGGLVFRPPPRSGKVAGSPGRSTLVWDERPAGSAFGGVRRPFLCIPFAGTQRTVVFFHGNAEDVAIVEPDLCLLRDALCVNIVAVEYPGYGLLQSANGEGPDVSNIDAAAAHALMYVVGKLGVPASQVILLGRSLGGGVALRLALFARDQLQWDVGAVILQCAFISIRQVAADYAGIAAAMMIPPMYDNLTAMRQLCTGAPVSWPPILVLHGDMDTVVAPYHGRTLWTEARQLGHPRVEASFRPFATHNRWDVCLDIAAPVSNFVARHMEATLDSVLSIQPSGAGACAQAQCPVS